LLDAGAAVDEVNNYGETALVYACDGGHHECAQALIDAQADVELTNNQDGQNALMLACESPPPCHQGGPERVRPGRIRCALALLAATAPFREADFPDGAESLMIACARLRGIELALATEHAVENAPPVASAEHLNLLKSDAHGIVANFAARYMNEL
jgi:hypothetical protein